MNNDKNGVYTVQIVTKAFEILELISDQRMQADLPRLAARVAMTRNKTYRLLTTLMEKGLVERDPLTGFYQLGISSISLAQKMMKHSSVISLAHPIMEDLAKRHDEAVYMTVIKGDEVLFLDMVDCGQQIKAMSLVGEKFPFFTNAAGKVIKALEARELPEWLSQRQRGRVKGVPDPKKLASELLEIRSNGGVAVDNGGLGEGISSVAVAVKDYAGKVIGAITLLGPSFRMMRERVEDEIVPSLIEGAALISQKFGFSKLSEG